MKIFNEINEYYDDEKTYYIVGFHEKQDEILFWTKHSKKTAFFTQRRWDCWTTSDYKSAQTELKRIMKRKTISDHISQVGIVSVRHDFKTECFFEMDGTKEKRGY